MTVAASGFLLLTLKHTSSFMQVFAVLVLETCTVPAAPAP